jgi:predicted phosphodiesterase
MQETVNTNIPVFIIGDVHGRFDALKERVRVNDLKDCILICVGDYGIGFSFSFKEEINTQRHLNDFFKERNIKFYTIRGNHDDPSYFRGASRLAFSNLELLEDYTTIIINTQKFLFVGGAVSIDRRFRQRDVSYWVDEIFIYDESKIVECDVLITHSTPTWLGPVDKDSISGWCAKDSTLWEECLDERKKHDRLFKLAKPKRSYHGHFHQSTVVDFDECWGTILDELEIKEHRFNG